MFSEEWKLFVCRLVVSEHKSIYGHGFNSSLNTSLHVDSFSNSSMTTSQHVYIYTASVQCLQCAFQIKSGAEMCLSVIIVTYS